MIKIPEYHLLTSHNHSGESLAVDVRLDNRSGQISARHMQPDVAVKLIAEFVEGRLEFMSFDEHPRRLTDFLVTRAPWGLQLQISAVSDGCPSEWEIETSSLHRVDDQLPPKPVDPAGPALSPTYTPRASNRGFLSRGPDYVYRLNLNVIRAALFDDANLAKRIARDYGAASELTGASLCEAVTASFQPVKAAPAHTPDEDVFRAAVLALASNSRRWSHVITALPQLEGRLSDYDPVRVAEIVHAPDQRQRLLGELKSCLGGQTAGRDAEAMIRFAEQLATQPEYGRRLAETRNIVQQALKVPSPAEVTAAVSLLIARGPEILPAGVTAPLAKVWGMGPALASEFLRNLGWPSFKPDRHIIRLLKSWIPEDERDGLTQGRPVSLLMRRLTREEREFLAFARVGEAVTPENEAINVADQLLWMLGAYAVPLRRKRRRTARGVMPTRLELALLMGREMDGQGDAVERLADELVSRWEYFPEAAREEAEDTHMWLSNSAEGM